MLVLVLMCRCHVLFGLIRCVLCCVVCNVVFCRGVLRRCSCLVGWCFFCELRCCCVCIVGGASCFLLGYVVPRRVVLCCVAMSCIVVVLCGDVLC